MSKRARGLAVTVILTLAALLLAPAAATAAPPSQIAEVTNTGSKLLFDPVIEAKDVILTVTGPCNYQLRLRASKDELTFRLDETTIDGVYRFELVAIPYVDPEIVDILQGARKYDDQATVNALCRDGKLPGAPAVQTSGFSVIQGRIVWDPEAIEDRSTGSPGGAIDDDPATALLPARNGLQPRDFVIIDDLIVDGSACIGFDCVNGETFGFDTIRLKENNLRIKFDDTSTAASFPRNDWQLTANDSANGGASKFSIDDVSGSRTPFTIEANARSHSLYVDDGGRIGSRTSTPSVEIHTIDGDTPTLRLQQDGSSGFAPQTWDVAGNETNFFVRDVTNGSTLPFRIRPGAPSSAIFIDVDGDVGIGDSSPDASLNVQRTDGTAQILVEDSGTIATNSPLLQLESTNGTTQIVQFALINNSGTWRFDNGTGGNFSITKEGTGGQEMIIRDRADGSGAETLDVDGSIEADAFNLSSSRTLKTDFAALDPREILSKVVDLPVKSWRFKDSGMASRHIGPFAEDFYAAFGVGPDEQHISTVDLGGVALAAIQGLNQKVQELEVLNQKVEELEAEKAALASALDEMRAMIQSIASAAE